MNTGSSAYVLLEDGARFDGDAVGADGHALGEVVFTTSMSGYQETVTDPSFAGQIVTFTYPHIGNYGISAEAMESDRIHARGVIMRSARNGEDAPTSESGWLDWLKACDVVAITGVDTRSLVRHIRDAGAMRGGVFPASMAQSDAAALIVAEPSMQGADFARQVTQSEKVTLGPLGDDVGIKIAAIDTGIKDSIVRELRERGVTVELHPCSASASELLAGKPNAVFLANGPGDPAALDYVVNTVTEVVGQVPTYGICLGHQLLCRALGLETYKLPFGHRGGNHPVKDLASGRIEITSQNHGFAVLAPGGAEKIEHNEPVKWETAHGTAELTHINLYDRTVEGLRVPEAKATAVQYHPEAGPGPHDACHFFDQLVQDLTDA